MKKSLFIVLSLLIALSASARNFSYRYKGNTLTYTVIDEDAKTCMTAPGSGWGEGYYVSGDLVIPEVAMDGETGFTIIAIGDFAFSGSKNLLTIVMPNTITEIGRGAFVGCESLNSIDIPNSVTIIGIDAFSLCRKMTSVSFGASVSVISQWAFWGCHSLESISIPNSVSEIGDCAFADCSSITGTIDIPNSVMTIGSSPFFGCQKVTDINVGNDNDYFCSKNGVLFNKDSTTIIEYPAGKKENEYVIPSTVISIGERAFAYNLNLNTVCIPESVTEINFEAFNQCSGLSSIIIPNSVNFIGANAFSYCDNLKSVEFGKSVSNIGENAFRSCINIKSVKIKDLLKWSLTNFGSVTSNPICYSQSFIVEDSSEPLTQLNINALDQDISPNAFYNAKNLETIRINAKSIGKNAFYGCSNIKKICLDIKELSDHAFGDNNSLNTVYSITETPPVAPDNAFSNFYGTSNYQGITLYVPFGSVSKYEDSATCWWNFKDILEDEFSNLNDIFGNDFNNSVDEITSSFDINKPYEIYNLNGMRIMCSNEDLSSGIYIIKQGNITKKIIVR